MLKKESFEKELERLHSIQLNPSEITNKLLEELNTTPIKTPVSMVELIRRPELNYEMTKILDPDRKDLLREIRLQVETHIKYEGYIKKQMIQIEQFKKLENRRLDPKLDYTAVKNLSNESREKLNLIKPDSVGQASRISGVSPSDINMLLIYLEQKRREGVQNG